MTLVILLVRYHLDWIVYLVEDIRNFVSDRIFWPNTANKTVSTIFVTQKTLHSRGEVAIVSCTMWLCKGKAIPLLASKGPEGSCRLRLTDLKTVGTWKC
jgi:hypothetical protein